MTSVAKLRGAHNFQLVGIGLPGDRSKLESFVRTQGLDFPVLDDSSGAASHPARNPEVIPPGIHMDFQKAYESAVGGKQLADVLLPMHGPMLYSTRHVP